MPNLYLGPNDFEVFMALTNFSYLGESLMKSLTHFLMWFKGKVLANSIQDTGEGIMMSQASQTNPTLISLLTHY